MGGNGIMGYVEIPSIQINLPIYHGTDSETLERGIGHLLGSSLPIGGASTHSVLSGHSGLAGQKMFTDLLPGMQTKIPSLILLEQILTLDKRRLLGYIGSLSDSQMERVNEALRCSLEL